MKGPNRKKRRKEEKEVKEVKEIRGKIIMAIQLYGTSIAGIDNVEFSQALSLFVADILSTSSQLLIFFGPILGGTFFGSIGIVFALAALRVVAFIQSRIFEELSRRTTTTESPSVTTECKLFQNRL